MVERTLVREVPEMIDQDVTIQGYVDNIRKLGGIRFLVLRDRSGVVQAVLEDQGISVGKHDIVSLTGEVKKDERAVGGYELRTRGLDVISSPEGQLPVSIRPGSKVSLDVQLAHRPISLRNPATRDIFSFQQTLAEGFRNYLRSNDFVEIFTPKIVPAVAESGSKMFELDYFGSPALLTQSPQFYKQMMVGTGLERVFEVGHVYRAEDHDTPRHLNEYVSMDFEMGFIDSFKDVMDMHEGFFGFLNEWIQTQHGHLVERMGITLPSVGSIPRIPLLEMKERIQSKYGKQFASGKDIDPEGERLASQIAKDEFGSDFVFLTHYPRGVRPFYTMPNSEDSNLTDSFDLLLKGLEITTGGQRIHDYNQLLENMKRFEINHDSCEGYVSAFKFGMPPHGGLGLGLERLTMQMLGLNNIREAALFPRDRKRYSP